MKRNPLQITLLLILVAAVWGVSWVDFRAHTAEHHEQFDQLGDALAGTSEGVVLRLCRGGKYDPEELQSTLQQLREDIGAQSLVLSAQEAGVILEATDAMTVDAGSTQLFVREFGTLEPRGQGRRGRGPTSMVELPTKQLVLTLALPTHTLDARLSADLRRFLGLASSLSVALLLFVLVLNSRMRSVALATDLARAKQKLEGMEFLHRLGAGLAHETRTPLGILRGFAQELSSGKVPDERIPSVANTIIEQADRTVSRLDEFMLLSRPAELRRERFELHALLVEMAELLHPDLEAVEGELQLGHFEMPIHADKEQTRRLFMNLLLNGVQALEPGGTLTVEALGDMSGVRLRDDGPGVPKDLCDTLFEPYATRRTGGTGLGLAIVRRIANEHGWQVEHEAVSPHGAAFTVTGFEA